jgi:hypothetical protein
VHARAYSSTCSFLLCRERQESPKSQNSSQGHPPNEGPEKPRSIAHHRRASTSSAGDSEDDAKAPAGGPAHRTGEYQQDGDAGGHGGGEEAFSSIYREPLLQGAATPGMLSLWESPLEVRLHGKAAQTSDQMSASELRRAAGGGGRASASAGGLFGRGGSALSADPWDDQGATRRDENRTGAASAAATGGEENGGGRGGGRVKVEQLDRAAGGLSNEANGVVRELTWENSSLQRRVEVQANALIELSVEKERWVTERAAIQQREKEAQARAHLLLEEKTQLKESLQAVIEGLLEEISTLKTGGAAPPVAPPAAAPPPQQAPAPEPVAEHSSGSRLAHAQAHSGGAGAEQAPSARLGAAAAPVPPRQNIQDRPPPPAAAPSIAPFLGVAVGEPALVGDGASDVAAPPAAHEGSRALLGGVGGVDEGAASAGVGARAVGDAECGGAEASTPASPSRKNLEWSLLLSPEGPAVPEMGAAAVSAHSEEPLEGDFERPGGRAEPAPAAPAPAPATPSAADENSSARPHANAPPPPLQAAAAAAPSAPPKQAAGVVGRLAPPSRPFPPELLAHPGDKDLQIDLRHLTNPPPPAAPAAPVILYVAAGVDSLLGLVTVVLIAPVCSECGARHCSGLSAPFLYGERVFAHVRSRL